MKTAELRALVRKRFTDNGCAVFDEVRSETGYTVGKAVRSADMFAMSLWRSKGIEFHGFELKVSRGDWLRELKQPAKAETIAKYVERWWLVVPSLDVARVEELPHGWGLLVVSFYGPNAVGLEVKHKAPLRQAEPLDRLFLAALVRKVGRGELSVDGKSLVASADLARSTPNDADLGAAVRALLTEGA